MNTRPHWIIVSGLSLSLFCFFGKGIIDSSQRIIPSSATSELPDTPVDGLEMQTVSGNIILGPWESTLSEDNKTAISGYSHRDVITSRMDHVEITCPNDITINLLPGFCVQVVLYEVTATTPSGEIPTLEQTDISSLTSGDIFPIGTTVQTWSATLDGHTAECTFSITIIESASSGLIACNDTIHVGIGPDCEVQLFTDMILEGNTYGCYDHYIISVENIGTDTGSITFSGAGLTGGYYHVTITDPDTDNYCSGVMLLEDKIPPQILCACPPGTSEADTCQISCLELDLLVAGNIPLHLYPQVIENCGYTVSISNINVNDIGCGEGTVLVSWLVTDAAGFTASCVQEFEILPLEIDGLVFPPNYEGACASSSHPNITGWPQFNGQNLTDQAGLCNLFLGYWDLALEDCGSGQKILRTWTVLDWCTEELITQRQIIKLSDVDGPVLICPADLTVGTDFWFCNATVNVPKPTAHDVCSSIAYYKLTSSSGNIIQFGNNYVIANLELGTHLVTWTAADVCGNRSSCTFTITVVDDVVPVAICDHHTIVSLINDGPQGITLVPAYVFDDGSYDNCGPVTFRARRMTSCIDFDWTTNGGCIDDIPNGQINGDDLGTSFNPCVPFACCDVPRSGSRNARIMVELEVTDQAGNKNYCMVEVDVQDKIAPDMECPPDISVSCDFWFPIQEGVFRDVIGNRNGNLDEDPLSSIFGNMYDALFYNKNQAVRQPIIINDPGNPHFPQPHNWGLDGWAEDNCLADLEVRVTLYDDCSGTSLPGNAPPGAVKLIERRFTVKDNQQGFNPGVCTQRIWVVDFDPFYISDTNCNNSNPNDGVRWPCDVTITTCPDELTNTGQPTIFADACNLIGVTFVDTRFDIFDGACYKILREWKVIDWCQYNSSTGYGLWSYTQVIKVQDHQAPQFLDCPQNPVTLCVANDGVRLPASNQSFLGENDPNASHCSVHVTISHRVRETCNGEVSYDVKFYPFNGTEFILVQPRTTVPLNANHEADLIFNSEVSPVQSIRRNGLPYNTPLCGNYHKILWTVEDGCGNQSHCEYLLRLEDCKQPSPVCIQGLSTVVMPSNCEVTLWAKDFNASSFDDCTSAEDLLYSFRGDQYEPSMTFNSTNIPAYSVELSIPIWVADGGTDDNCNGTISWSERNKDFCLTTIVFTDNSGECDLSGSIIYEGEIRTYLNEPIEAVQVRLKQNNAVIYSMKTIDNGKYALIVPEVPDERYTIKPDRLDHARNGVSTLDLVRIQKHLLGIELFNSPFQYIAANANNSGHISAIDLIEIRKLILGIYATFPQNDSWRFVHTQFDMTDPHDPWPLEEEIDIQYDGYSVSNLDFIGIKIGDVNHSAQANVMQIQPRQENRIMNLVLESIESVSQGDVVDIHLTFPVRVSGFQATIHTSGLEYSGIYSDDIQILDQHVGLLSSETKTVSWHDENMTASVHPGTMSILLRFIATQSGRVSDMFSITDQIAAAEAYTFEEEVWRLRLDKKQNGADIEFALHQNEPNPWTGETLIPFELPEEGLVRLSLFDVTGKVHYVHEHTYPKGYHKVSLSQHHLPQSGMYYYRLDSGIFSATKKLIRLD